MTETPPRAARIGRPSLAVPTLIAGALTVTAAVQLRYLVFGGLYLQLHELGHEYADEQARLVGNSAGLVALVLPWLLLCALQFAWRPTSRAMRTVQLGCWPLAIACAALGWPIAAALWGHEGPADAAALARWAGWYAALAAVALLVGRLVSAGLGSRSAAPTLRDESSAGSAGRSPASRQ